MSVHPLTNVMPGLPKMPRHVIGTTGASADAGATQWAQATYDFAVQGGAVGTIGLFGSLALPSGAVILAGHVEVLTPVTSGGAATLAVQVEGAGDMVAAAVVSGAPWSTTGVKSIVPVGTGATSVKTTAARDISVVVAAAALTAGKVVVRLSYLDPTAN